MATFIHASQTGHPVLSDKVIAEYQNVNVMPDDPSLVWDGAKWGSPVGEISASITANEMRSRRMVILNDLDKLNVGNFASIGKDKSRLNELDLLYYNTANPKQKNNGIYTSKKGYLVFPQLAWNKEEENRTVCFVVYFGSDSRYEVFGLCSKEQYNFDSNDYNKVELGLRFRSWRGAYYQYGLTADGQNGFGYQGYFNIGKNSYYRFDIENNGAKDESCTIYRLKSGDFADWFIGTEYVDRIKLAIPPARKGITYYPYIGEYLGSNNQLLGVLLR